MKGEDDEKRTERERERLLILTEKGDS